MWGWGGGRMEVRHLAGHVSAGDRFLGDTTNSFPDPTITVKMKRKVHAHSF